MLTILNKYQFAIAFGLFALAAFGFSIAMYVLFALTHELGVLAFGLGMSGVAIYVTVRAYEAYEQERGRA